MQVVKLYLFILLYVLTSTVHANEDAHGGGGNSAGHAEEKDAPAAEHGSGGEHGGSTKKSQFIKKDEYLEIRSAIEQTMAKIRSQKEELKKMLYEKEHITEPVAFRESTQKIKKAYDELREMYQSLEKNKIVIRFRFPEKGAIRNLESPDSLDELNAEAVLDKNVNETLKVLRHQYRVPASSYRKEKENKIFEDDYAAPIMIEK